ncbi:hypothetical protein [Paraclostridium bifermentans]|uniref:hypothetical protein n=1 Tax=Paraclostridium bifermentans TaxID=1490 RepID=UPI00374F29AA
MKTNKLDLFENKEHKETSQQGYVNIRLIDNNIVVTEHYISSWDFPQPKVPKDILINHDEFLDYKFMVRGYETIKLCVAKVLLEEFGIINGNRSKLLFDCIKEDDVEISVTEYEGVPKIFSLNDLVDSNK